MADKKRKGTKDKRAKKQVQKLVNELQLRKDIRERIRREREPTDFEEGVTMMRKEVIHAEDVRIGGIEGGGTCSTLIVLDGRGTKLTEIDGPCTNHWIIGMDETAARINAIVEKAKEKLDMDLTTPLDCLGLSLSGCEEETTNNQLVNTLREKYPNVAEEYVACSDTLGSLKSALDTGGIVLIAGTGSNGLLVDSDGKTYGCGGWGYMIGDEGSAYWIAIRACKYVFDDFDDLAKAPHPTSYVWPAMRSYFKVNDLKEMLSCLYSNFEKSNIAMFTKEVAAGCERGDPLCLHVFEEAGKFLARHVVALAKKANNDLKLAHGGLKVICVGSVWKSWEFLKKGFISEIHDASNVNELTLLRSKSAALGACYLAADKIERFFVKPYHENSETFFHYKRENYPKQNIK